MKKIRRISKKNGISVSQLIEDYLDGVYKNYNTEKLDIMKIKGTFGKVSKNFDWKEIKTQYLLEKYVK